MLWCLVLTIILITTACNSLQRGIRYKIPEAQIRVFKPNGFSIGIEDQPGISFIAFQVNINEDLQVTSPGDYHTELSEAQYGKWTFYVPHVQLLPGDVINYWIHVNKNHIGYQTNVEHFEVQDLENYSDQRIPHPNQTPADQTQSPSKTSNNNEQPHPAPETGADSLLNTCTEIVLNSTQRLLYLQEQVEVLREENRQLSNFVETLPDARMLTISEKIFTGDDARANAVFLIREKLQLNPDIVSAKRNQDSSITFEVRTVKEKLEILEAAKKKLTNSRISISS